MTSEIERFVDNHKFIDVVCNCKDRKGVRRYTYLGNFQVDTENMARFLCRRCFMIHVYYVSHDGVISKAITQFKKRIKNLEEYAIMEA